MNIIRRLKNLWKLSGIEDADTVPVESSTKPKQAKIVDMYDPLSIDLGENE